MNMTPVDPHIPVQGRARLGSLVAHTTQPDDVYVVIHNNPDRAANYTLMHSETGVVHHSDLTAEGWEFV